ncbi:uncharacterized protein TrAtP1_011371 [Trichoderma atroviride]|uniref:uncharacterized protein n=1 Tax=Hypocrea atroviridis TaxID=63577 RepID=UPI003317D8E3|nr:hypothetical protein TrAtP1_011371 [Trichoderma atroviride]
MGMITELLHGALSATDAPIPVPLSGFPRQATAPFSVFKRSWAYLDSDSDGATPASVLRLDPGS